MKWKHKQMNILSWILCLREGKRVLGESFDSTTICEKLLVTGQVKERHRIRDRQSVVTRERDIVTDQG